MRAYLLHKCYVISESYGCYTWCVEMGLRELINPVLGITTGVRQSGNYVSDRG